MTLICDLVQQSRGRWYDIITQLCGVQHLPSRSSPCPMCGGDDRFRFDDKDGSGSWYCNQCGGRNRIGGGGDGFDLLSALIGGSMVARDALDGWLNGVSIGSVVARKFDVVKPPADDPADSWVPIIPIPHGAVREFHSSQWRVMSIATGKYSNRFSLVSPVVDSLGQMWGAVVRIETEKGKITPQVTYCRNKDTGALEWVFKGMPQGKPLVGIQWHKPELPTIIVEGEKTWHAVRRIARGHNVLTWVGGCRSWQVSNWSEIYGHDCVVWPDADEIGVSTAHLIADYIGARVVDVSGLQKPEGWDLADAISEGWEWDRILKYIC